VQANRPAVDLDHVRDPQTGAGCLILEHQPGELGALGRGEALEQCQIQRLDVGWDFGRDRHQRQGF
jgi:hypothetical protein